MLSVLKKADRKEVFICLAFIILTVCLYFIPTGFEKQLYLNAEGARATVLSVDNSGVYSTGLIKQGDQRCTIRIESGGHKKEEVTAMNLYTGKFEFDKVFVPGDKAWVLLEQNGRGEIIFANMIDHYRIGKEMLLLGMFALCLVLFSGFTGLRTLLSFSFALLSIWKLLIPAMLRGANPLIVALVIGNAIAVATLLLVAGMTKKAYAAILGTMICSLATCLLAVVFGGLFKIDGVVMQWSESLFYAGFERLDLTGVFLAGIYLACSGAIIDLAIDISAALDELKIAQPDIGFGDMLKSGLRIGRSIVGSQTTTLLLAYMGSYISVMMVYMAQGTPMLNILNSKSISSEILHTFVGCIGLVFVCPLTSVICAFMYQKQPDTEAGDSGKGGVTYMFRQMRREDRIGIGMMVLSVVIIIAYKLTVGG